MKVEYALFRHLSELSDRIGAEEAIDALVVADASAHGKEVEVASRTRNETTRMRNKDIRHELGDICLATLYRTLCRNLIASNGSIGEIPSDLRVGSLGYVIGQLIIRGISKKDIYDTIFDLDISNGNSTMDALLYDRVVRAIVDKVGIFPSGGDAINYRKI